MIKRKADAPDFSLNDPKGKIHRLSDYKGKRILLSFRSLAWTPI